MCAGDSGCRYTSGARLGTGAALTVMVNDFGVTPPRPSLALTALRRRAPDALRLSGLRQLAEIELERNAQLIQPGRASPG